MNMGGRSSVWRFDTMQLRMSLTICLYMPGPNADEMHNEFKRMEQAGNLGDYSPNLAAGGAYSKGVEMV